MSTFSDSIKEALEMKVNVEKIISDIIDEQKDIEKYFEVIENESSTVTDKEGALDNIKSTELQYSLYASYLQTYRVLIEEKILVREKDFCERLNKAYYQTKFWHFLFPLMYKLMDENYTKEQKNEVKEEITELKKSMGGRPKVVNRNVELTLKEQATIFKVLSSLKAIKPKSTRGISEMMECLEIGSSNTINRMEFEPTDREKKRILDMLRKAIETIENPTKETYT